MATGAIERPISFACNDVPGVMLASAVRDYAVNFGVAVGERTVVATACDDGYRTAIALKQLGLEVPAVLDARSGGGGELASRVRDLGIRIECGTGIAAVRGRKAVTGVAACMQEGEGGAVEEIACDAVAMAGGWSPAVHLWSHAGASSNGALSACIFGPILRAGQRAPMARSSSCPPDPRRGRWISPKFSRAPTRLDGPPPRRSAAPLRACPRPPPRRPRKPACAAVWMMPAKAGIEKRENPGSTSERREGLGCGTCGAGGIPQR